MYGKLKNGPRVKWSSMSKVGVQYVFESFAWVYPTKSHCHLFLFRLEHGGKIMHAQHAKVDVWSDLYVVCGARTVAFNMLVHDMYLTKGSPHLGTSMHEPGAHLATLHYVKCQTVISSDLMSLTC